MSSDQTMDTIPKTAESYRCLKISVTPETYYIMPTDDTSIFLCIDRLTEAIFLEPNIGQCVQLDSTEIKYALGIVGKIKLIGSSYLIVIKDRLLTGKLCGHDIYQVDKIELLPFKKSQLHLTKDQIDMNSAYLTMIKNALSTPNYYFSYSYDLTRNVQFLKEQGPEFFTQTLFERADKRFTWNNSLVESNFEGCDILRFCLPIVHGFVNVQPSVFSYVGPNTPRFQFYWCLVARRSCKRAGTRLFRRGIDMEGNVANFVETEQIVEFDNNVASFLQIRGSIPLFWSQYPNLTLKIPPAITPNKNHVESCVTHLNNLKNDYGNIVLVNLINHTGPEGELEKKFKSIVELVGDKFVRYEAYDFHHECKNMQWHKLSNLIDKLAGDQDRFGYFLIDKTGKVLLKQCGIFRTNCIDCLDRTNVVQSLFAWRNLSQVLKQLGLLNNGMEVQNETLFYRTFQNVWADHADCISIEYSGTGALKTDYTRTGKRTAAGAFFDVVNSLKRYYKNNFKDGNRQDSIDLLLGNYKVKPEECVSAPCPMKSSPSTKSMAFQIIFLLALAMFFLNTIFTTDYAATDWLTIFFWGLMIVVTIGTLIHFGTELVDFPKLCPIKTNELD